MSVNFGHCCWQLESNNSTEQVSKAGQLLHHGSGCPCVQRFGGLFKWFVVMTYPKELLLSENCNQERIHGS